MAERKNYLKKWQIALIVGIIFLGFSLFVWLTFPAPMIHHKDADIIKAIGQSRSVMRSIYYDYNNYQNFTCNNNDMIALCTEIDASYGLKNGAEPIIAHDSANNSQAVCIYSPIEGKPSFIRWKGFWYNLWYDYRHHNQKYWYCADSTGTMGFTTIDPRKHGYCVEGKSAVCPPIIQQ